MEWARKGITINNIGPGVVTSPTAVANYGPLGEMMFGNTEKIIPMGKLGQVDEHLVAPTMFFLSPACVYVTGTVQLTTHAPQGLLLRTNDRRLRRSFVVQQPRSTIHGNNWTAGS